MHSASSGKGLEGKKRIYSAWFITLVMGASWVFTIPILGHLFGIDSSSIIVGSETSIWIISFLSVPAIGSGIGLFITYFGLWIGGILFIVWSYFATYYPLGFGSRIGLKKSKK